MCRINICSLMSYCFKSSDSRSVIISGSQSDSENDSNLFQAATVTPKSDKHHIKKDSGELYRAQHAKLIVDDDSKSLENDTEVVKSLVGDDYVWSPELINTNSTHTTDSLIAQRGSEGSYNIERADSSPENTLKSTGSKETLPLLTRVFGNKKFIRTAPQESGSSDEQGSIHSQSFRSPPKPNYGSTEASVRKTSDLPDEFSSKEVR